MSTNKKCLINSKYTIKETPSGYDGDNDPDPPSIEGDDVCPYCRLSPCIIARPPNWLRGSAPPNLGNMSKRFKLYKKFWTLLGQLGVWNDPHYLALKVTKTSIMDRREVMPECTVTVSCHVAIVSVINLLIFRNRRSEEDSRIHQELHTLTLYLHNHNTHQLTLFILLQLLLYFNKHHPGVIPHQHQFHLPSNRPRQ